MPFSPYQERVLETFMRFQETWQVHCGYDLSKVREVLLLLPWVKVEEERFDLGYIMVRENSIFGENKIIVSELEKLLNRKSALGE